MPTLTVPLSRIEGHARASIEFRGSQILAAHFDATEKRGFEIFCQGAPAEQMPVIVPRICGVCSTAHHIAAVKALEAAFEVEPPPKAITIRGLMMLGQLIQNQATSLFLFTMPDFPGREGLPSIFHFDMQDAGLAARALEVRRLGTDLITLAGGQFIHPIKAAVGGVTSGIPHQEADELRRRFQDHLPMAEELFSRYHELLMGLRERIGTLGDDTPTHYIGAVEPGHTYYGSTIRIMTPEGSEAIAFEACDYARYLTEVPLESSYSNGTLYVGQILNCNSLARANMLPVMGTLRADAHLERFHREWGQPAHAILLFDLARGIELIYGIERAIEILSEDLEGAPGVEGDLRVGYTPRDGEGCGLVEAPRGPLIHHYVIADGLIRRVKFIIPTQHNILAIERALCVAAERYITEQGISLELERAVGRVVRAFDPCIACATH